MIDLPKISADVARARSQSNSAKDYFEIVMAGSACVQHAADLLAELDRTLIELGRADYLLRRPSCDVGNMLADERLLEIGREWMFEMDRPEPERAVRAIAAGANGGAAGEAGDEKGAIT